MVLATLLFATALFASSLALGLPDSLLNASEVKWSPEKSKVYLGSPSVLRCSNGSLLISNDQFGAGVVGTASVSRSDDNGETWAPVGAASLMYWATLFARPGDSAVYLMGTNASDASAQISIARSADCGSTWESTLLTASPTAYSTGPTPVLLHAGRLWRAYEWNTGDGWAQYSTLVISAPANATDLLAPSTWTLSGALSWSAVSARVPASWGDPSVVPSYGWLEGNAVEPPDSKDSGVYIILRVNSQPAANKAALVHVSGPTAAAAFVSWIEFFPGGMSKFTVRRDSTSGLYVTLSNNIEDAGVTAPVSCGPGPLHTTARAASGPLTCCSTEQMQACESTSEPSCWWCHASGRNNLTLAVSADLVNWTLALGPAVMQDDTAQPSWMSQLMTGFQYADWQFDGSGGSDIVTAVRTSYRGAQSYHNSNRILHQRISNWRHLIPGQATRLE